ncbi:MAG: VOC family protein [Anaerolineales bacterium]|jgi:catechol 2,3-dioxygenase-like lactoylglutathione lyase family enzyme|nr:VOC family protein [Anaerolineales bacterium]HNQ95144.1 VOC family protein [Anaerolineales bacterium]
MKTHFILYVSDQHKSSAFYRNLFAQEPTLDVDGMTEFTLNDGAVLGLMPETGIKRLLGEIIKDPKEGRGIPRAELYLLVEEPQFFYERALANGARALSPLEKRNWGDAVSYCEDPDGHILAFAKREVESSI